MVTIKVYQNIQDMTGMGEEWLLDKYGDPIAVFIDGDLRCNVFNIVGKSKQMPVKVMQ